MCAIPVLWVTTVSRPRPRPREPVLARCRFLTYLLWSCRPHTSLSQTVRKEAPRWIPGPGQARGGTTGRRPGTEAPSGWQGRLGKGQEDLRLNNSDSLGSLRILGGTLLST